MSMYVRIKRKKQTIFLHVEQTETVQGVKAQIGEVVGQNPADIRLFGSDKSRDMPDSALLSEQPDIKNDSIIYMVFRNAGGDGWEEVDVTAPGAGGEMKG